MEDCPGCIAGYMRTGGTAALASPLPGSGPFHLPGPDPYRKLLFVVRHDPLSDRVLFVVGPAEGLQRLNL